MNKRKKEWQRQVKEATGYYEFKNDSKHEFYNDINRRKRLKYSRGINFYINWIIRLIIGISLMYLTLKNLIS